MIVNYEVSKDRGQYLTLLVATLVSIVSFCYYLNMRVVTAFSDGQSRLIIARSFFDSVTPNFWQNGGVWLPLPQFAMSLTAWSDPMYKSGASGALVSMVSFVATAFFIYKAVRLVTKDSFAAWMGAAAIATPSMLYLQSTPMSESMLNAFYAGSIYFMAKWFYFRLDRFLFYAGIMMTLAMTTRYEAWILFPVVSVCFFIGAWGMKLPEKKRISASFLFFAILPVLAVGGWILYNAEILNDPFYFYRSEYAPWAFAKRAMELMPEEERTAGNLALSLKIFTRTTLDTVGWINTFLALAGMALLLPLKKIPGRVKLLAVFCFILPYPFYIASIYQGTSVIILHPNYANGVNWGTRYGVLLLPAAGFFIGLLTAHLWHAKYLMLPLLLISFAITWNTGNLSLNEALVNNLNGKDAQIKRDAGKWFVENYDGGMILMQRSTNTEAVFEMTPDIKLKNILNENNTDPWKEALENPVGNRWIFMRINTDGAEDDVYRMLNSSPVLSARYNLLYDVNGIKIYRIKEGR